MKAPYKRNPPDERWVSFCDACRIQIESMQDDDMRTNNTISMRIILIFFTFILLLAFNSFDKIDKLFQYLGK